MPAAATLAERRNALRAQRERCRYCDAPISERSAVFEQGEGGLKALCADCARLKAGKTEQEFRDYLLATGFLTCGE